MNLCDLIGHNFNELPSHERNGDAGNILSKKKQYGARKLKGTIFSGIYSFSEERVISEDRYRKGLFKASSIKNPEEFEDHCKGQEQEVCFREQRKRYFLKIIPEDGKYRVKLTQR